MSERRWTPGLLALVAITLACKKPPAPAPEVPDIEPPVATPDGRIVDLALASPDAFWARVQRGVGGMVAILPSTFGGLLCTASGLDVAFAAEVDGTAPAFAVLALSPEGRWSFALAARLVDGSHARAVLASADTARFEVRDAGAFGLVVPKGGGGLGGPSALAVGIAGRGRSAYLLVADSESALTRLGPYAYRTLPARPVPESGLVAEVPRDALTGTLRDAAQRAWTRARTDALREDAEMRASHGGRAPDFGDAPAIVATMDSIVARVTALAADLDAIRVVLDADADTLHGKLTLTPAPGGGAATELLDAMTLGDASPLARLPPEAVVGVMTREAATGRARDGAAIEATLAAALGARLRPDDAKKLDAAITDWESARGDWLAAAVLPASPPPGHGLTVTLRTPAQDGEKAARAVEELMELAALPALRAPLRSHVSVTGVTVSHDSLASAGGPPIEHVGLAMLQRAGSKETPAGIAWGIQAGDVLLAAGEDPRSALASSATQAAPALQPALAALGHETSFALVARPFAAASKQPVVLGWGRHGGAAWARVDVPDIVVRELVRRQAGL